MINQQAISQFQKLTNDFDSFVNQHHDDLTTNVHRYLELKHLLHEVNVAEDAYFQRQFSYFYGLNQRIKREIRPLFYRKMEEIKNTHEPIDVRSLTEELSQVLGKNHFSFCSKMANLINDEKYPIYDSQVAKVFHRKGLGYDLDYKTNLYADVKDTYESLKDSPVITAFQDKFNAHEMGYMKVLDALFWVIGAPKK